MPKQEEVEEFVEDWEYLATMGVAGEVIGGQVADACVNGISYTPNPVDGVGNVLSTSAGAVAGGFAVLNYAVQVNKLRDMKPESVPVNPLLAAKGISGPSPKTKQFLLKRINKNLAGSLSSAAGAVASSATQINTAGTLKNGSSTATTAKHLHELNKLTGHLDRLLALYPNSRTVNALALHLKTIIK